MTKKYIGTGGRRPCVAPTFCTRTPLFLLICVPFYLLLLCTPANTLAFTPANTAVSTASPCARTPILIICILGSEKFSSVHVPNGSPQTDWMAVAPDGHLRATCGTHNGPRSIRSEHGARSFGALCTTYHAQTACCCNRSTSHPLHAVPSSIWPVPMDGRRDRLQFRARISAVVATCASTTSNSSCHGLTTKVRWAA